MTFSQRRIADRQGALSLGAREANLEALSRDDFDLLVVGGGILGCGIALDASARGLRTALVEASDFSGGTSSRSSKLIHGGLRYLERFEFSLTWEASAERRRLLSLAPGLVRPLPFVLPAYRAIDAIKYELGLWLYDAVAGFRNTSVHSRYRAGAALGRYPQLRRAGLRAAFRYHDAVTDDSRLTIQVAKVAGSFGAVAANYARVFRFLKKDGAIRGAAVHDVLDGREIEVSARNVVLACGNWVDELLALDSSDHIPFLSPAKGVSLTVEGGFLPSDHAFFIPVEEDGRLVFAVPWYDRVLLSTTDTPYRGDLSNPGVDEEDVDYLLRAANRVFPGWNLTKRNVVAAQAGLRALVRGSARDVEDLSRRERLIRTSSGLLAVAGGKLTTYRPIAEKVVDALRSDPDRRGRSGRLPPSPTHAIPLTRRLDSTWRPPPEILDGPLGNYLSWAYGEDAGPLASRARETPGAAACLSPGRPYIREEVRYAVQREMAVTVSDFLARRVRANLLDDENGAGCAPAVADIMAELLGWDEVTRQARLRDYLKLAQSHRLR